MPELHRANLFVILSELFNNALEHGLLRLDCGSRVGQEGSDRFLETKANRLRALAEGTISVELGVDGRLQKCARVRVSDSGNGFDWRKELGASAQAGERRGLRRVVELSRSVRFNEAGNDVVALYPL